MRSSRRTTRLFAASAAALAGFASIGGCAGDRAPADTSRAQSASVQPRVWFTSPANGDTVTSPVTVVMAVDGVTLVPAADNPRREGEGHLHLLLNRSTTVSDVPIPYDVDVVHMGTGATEHIFQVLPPGTHRLIAVFAYSDHVPDVKVATDTLTIVVK